MGMVIKIYKYIYRLSDGKVVNKLYDYTDVSLFYKDFPSEHLENIGVLLSDKDISIFDIVNYEIKNDKISKLEHEYDNDELLKIGQQLSIEQRIIELEDSINYILIGGTDSGL